MRNLLKTDFIRFLKSKQFLIIAIISVVVGIGMPILFYGLQEILKFYETDPSSSGMSFFSAKDFAFSSYGFQMSYTFMGIRGSSVSVVFIITAILFTIIVSSDFSYGIIRNKIIAGHSRMHIYLSLYITLYVFMFGVALISSLISFGVAGILFDYDTTGKIFLDDFGSLLLGILFGALGYLFFAGFICLFAIGLNKTPLAIIFTILLGFLGMLVGLLCDGIIEALIQTGSESNLIDILTFINCINIHKSMSELNKLDYKSYEIIANLINPIGWAGLVNFLGLLIFNKRDIK